MEKRLYKNVNKQEPLDRVDGKLKVTGMAKYSADYALPGLAYAVLVNSTIAKGAIKRIDTKQAARAPGVLDIISHLNAPKIPGYQTAAGTVKAPATARPLWVFYDEYIYFSGQPIALVIADTYERALYGASLVKTEYKIEEHQTELNVNIERAVTPRNWTDYGRGEVDAYKKAQVFIEQEYVHPVEVHNPMEMHCTIAFWEAADKVTVYDKTQGVKGAQRTIMDAFKLPEQNVQVNTLFMGGGFGSGLRTWPHVIATVLAAKKLNRPVKLVLGRDQMFTMVGYRPRSVQKIGIGATNEGKIIGITHEGYRHDIVVRGVYRSYGEHEQVYVCMSECNYQVQDSAA
jgi:xanthine dehydrogenase YagR molybdenum-binding subunit